MSCFPLKPHDFAIYNMSPHSFTCIYWFCFFLVEIACFDLNDFHIRM